MDKQAAAIVTQSKSLGLGFVLAFIFGGVGLFYASITGGIVMSIVQVITLVITFFTLGLGGILVPIVHAICLIWAIIAIKNHNEGLYQA